MYSQISAKNTPSDLEFLSFGQIEASLPQLLIAQCWSEF